MQAKYDARNPGALKKLAAAGAQLRPFPQDVLEACFKAANETYAEINATNATFKKVHDAMMAFRADDYLWFQVSEYPFDTFMMGQQRKKLLRKSMHPVENKALFAGPFSGSIAGGWLTDRIAGGAGQVPPSIAGDDHLEIGIDHHLGIKESWSPVPGRR